MKYVVFLLSFFSATFLWSQEMMFVFKGKVENSDLGKSEAGVSVAIVQSGSTLATANTASNGKYNLKGNVNYSSPFRVVFSKSGLVSKMINFDLSKMNEEDIPAGDEFRPIEALDMTMFKERDNVDFSFLKTQPVGDFDWNVNGLSIRLDHVAKNNIQNKILQLLAKADKDKMEAEMKYQQAIQKADAAYNDKKYEDALAKYEEALGYKPKEKYPADRIVELDALISAQKEQELAEKQENEEYYNLIEAADNLRDQGNLEGAISKYNEALTKKDEVYPKDQVAKLTKQIEDQKAEAENQAKYDALIKSADGFLKQNSLRAAKDKYTEALALKPSEKYPKDKLKEIEDKLSAQADIEAQKKKYDDAIAAADELFNSEKYNEAKSKYEEALTFEASATYPKQRIDLCIEKMKAAKAEAEKLEKIKALVAEGSTAMTKSNWEEAKAKFNAVLQLDDEHQIAIDKLAIIEKKIEDENNLALQEKKFNELVNEGDQASASDDLDNALSKYNEAKDIKMTPELQEKINTVKSKIQAREAEVAKKARYDELMTEAAALLSNENLEGAKSKYQEALGIDATQEEPKTKIQEIERLIAENNEVAARKASYEAAISSANNLFNAGKWEEAKAKYREAMTFDNTQSFPQDRISEIDKLIADKAEENRKREEIDALLSDANRLNTQKKYEEAKSKYEEVLALDPGNTIASSKLNEINTKLASMKDEAEKEEAFNQLKKEGFDLFAAEDYELSKQKLQEALIIKNDGDIVNKLSEINSILADLQSQKDLDDKYAKLISDAQIKESGADYAGAISKYREAGGLKPDESLPKEKIIELQDLMANAANQAEIDQKYRAFMERGDELMAQKEYLAAIKEFNKALNIKPSEQEPVDKAAEAERLEREKGQEVDAQYEKILTVAQKKIDIEDFSRATELLERAVKLKPADDRPKKMLTDIVELKKEIARFNELMSQGNQLAASKNYEEAKRRYESASNMKPTKQEPKDKIAEMDRLMAESSSAAEKEALYQDYMNKGSANQGTKNYELALNNYQNALGVKPGDVAAQNKINEIQQILDDIANSNARDLELKNKFDQFIKDADVDFADEYYMDAKSKYEEALKINPASTYAKTQIDECVRLERLKGNVEAQREYQKIIQAADKYFDLASYDKSKGYYLRALSFRSDDPYPKQRLAEIEAILNPVELESVELEDLGVPFDNSIMDGQALLEKAEAERKLVKNTKIEQKHIAIKDLETDMTQKKTQDHYDNSNSIYMVQQMISVDAGESDMNRQATVDALRQSELELQNEDRRNIKYEHSENLSDQNTIYIIQEESALVYGEKEAVYAENSDIMKNYNTSQANAVTEKNRVDYGLNIASDQTLSDVKLLIDEGVRDDYAERAKTSGQVVSAQKYAGQVETEKHDDRYEILLANKKEVNDVEISVGEYAIVETEKARDNNLELVDVRNDVIDGDKVRSQVETASVYKVNAEIAEVKVKVLSDQEGLEENRMETTEVLKASTKEMQEAHFNEFNTELAKYIGNKERINEEVKVNNAVNDLALEAHGKKVEYVEYMDKKANIQTQKGLEGDEIERLNAKKSIDLVYIGVEADTKDEVDKNEKSTTILADVNKTLKAQETADNIGEQEKHYDAQDKISNIDNSPQTTVKAANALGEEYPEGVSQESFTRSDQNGLMTTIITRRVVVVDGHADIYVRTQTMNGITYSKNGNPSLEHVWSKETQGAHLERHY